VNFTKHLDLGFKEFLFRKWIETDMKFGVFSSKNIIDAKYSLFKKKKPDEEIALPVIFF
jgi:hypothetical protein